MERLYRYSKVITAIAGVLLLFLIVQWFAGSMKDPNQMGIIESMTMEMDVQVPQGAMPVAIEVVNPAAFASSVSYTGTIEAYNDVSVYPRIEGWVTSMAAYAGDRVKKGQILAQLDIAELASRYETSQSQQVMAESTIASAKADLDYWENEIKRSEALYEDDVITREEYERDKAKYASVKARYNEAQAGYQAMASNAETQGIQLGYSTIRSPIDGVVTDRMIDEGVLVRPGMPVFRLAQLSPVRLQVHVAEDDYTQINTNGPVRVWKGSDKKGEGDLAHVTSIFPSRDLLTRTAVVEALLPNPNMKWIPGDFVTVDIETGQKNNALSVANAALIEKDQQQAVWTVQGGKASLRHVTTGAKSSDRTEIVSGLTAGDKVIVKGHEGLLPSADVVEAEYGPDGLVALPQQSFTHRFTAVNQYQVKQTDQHMVLTAGLDNPPGKVGHNDITLKLKPLHGQLPEGLTVETDSLMVSMPNMSVSKPSVQKKEKGIYHISMHASMVGLWQLDVTVKNGLSVIGKARFELEAEK